MSDELSFVILPISLFVLVLWYKPVEVVLVFLPYLWEEQNTKVSDLNERTYHIITVRDMVYGIIVLWYWY